MTNEFLVSVADAVIRDPITKAGIAYGKANITSAFNLSMSSQDVRAGINNPLIYSYYHTRELGVTLSQAIFAETFLALNVGGTVQTGAVNVLQTDCIVLSSSGSGVLSSTPIGNVEVFLPDGTVQTVTPSVKNITVTGANNKMVNAIYTTSKMANQITVETVKPPSIVDLTLIAEIRSSDQTTVKKYLQINIPRFQIAGNYTLDLAADGVSNETLEGRALATTSSDCTTGDYYAKISYIPVTESIVYSNIAATPSTIYWPKATAQSTQITVLGIRGGIYDNANITSECTFTRVGTTGSGIIVGSTGLISTSASAIPNPTTIQINVTYPSGSLVDYVMINVT